MSRALRGGGRSGCVAFESAEGRPLPWEADSSSVPSLRYHPRCQPAPISCSRRDDCRTPGLPSVRPRLDEDVLEILRGPYRRGCLSVGREHSQPRVAYKKMEVVSWVGGPAPFPLSPGGF